MTTKKSTKVSPMDQFRTAKFHSEAQKLPLFLPDGTESEHYLQIIGVKSPIMRKKKSDLIRNAAKSIKEGEWNDDVAAELNTQLIASAIVGWSFDEECSYENVYQFLVDAPEIFDAVDVFCADDTNYFSKK